jgi:membrane protease YdiL (CAAX protease family)
VEPAWDLEGVFAGLEQIASAAELAEARAQLDQFPRPVLVLVLLLQALGAGLSLNAVAAFGEEAGWRGLMLRELRGDEPGRFWRVAVTTGVLWGLWHAPLIAQGHTYPAHPVVGVVMMVAFCVLLAPLHAHVRVAGGSVAAAAVLHGTLNASGGFAVLFLRGGNDLLVGLTGLAGFLVLGVVNAALCWWRRQRP